MAEYRLCNHPDEDHEWQDAMRARQNDPVRSDYSTEGRGGSPIPSLSRMLTALYAAEVDFNIASAWDAGLAVAIQKPRSDGWTHRSFSVGRAPHDFPDWTSVWDAVVFFICETVVRDWDNLEDGAPVDIWLPGLHDEHDAGRSDDGLLRLPHGDACPGDARPS